MDLLNKIPPRENRLPWQDRHMLEALLTSKRSPDPNTQVGACLVSPENKILSTGYNGFPSRIENFMFSWERSDEDPLKTKYPFVVHAEKNAICNATSSLKLATLYTTLYPCNECMKDILQAGVTSIVYLEDKYPNIWQTQASKLMASAAGIIQRQHVFSQNAKIALEEILSIL